MTEIIISIPTGAKEDSGANLDFRFGYHKDQNQRSKLEDTLVWQTLKQKLTPQAEQQQLTPREIAHRLWTAYRLLDK